MYISVKVSTCVSTLTVAKWTACPETLQLMHVFAHSMHRILHMPKSCVEHAAEVESYPFVRFLYKHCQVPICWRCEKGVLDYRVESTNPMSLANDHYYGYIHRDLISENVKLF